MVFLLLVSVLFQRPLTFIILVGGIGGRGVIKMASAKINRLTRRLVEHCTPHADGAWLNELGWSHIPTSLPKEQTAKTDMLSIQVFSIVYS